MPPASMASKTDVNGQLQHGWLLRFIVLATIRVVRATDTENRQPCHRRREKPCHVTHVEWLDRRPPGWRNWQTHGT